MIWARKIKFDTEVLIINKEKIEKFPLHNILNVVGSI